MKNDRIENLIQDGEQLVEKGFVKTYGFEETIAFIMSITQQIWRIAQKHKSFRMELAYDAKTLNTNYFFFAPTDKCAEGCMNQEPSKS